MEHKNLTNQGPLKYGNITIFSDVNDGIHILSLIKELYPEIITELPKIRYSQLNRNLLAKIEVLGDNNENRSDIVDKEHALHVTNKFKILDFYTINTGIQEKPFIQYNNNKLDIKRKKYQIGDIVIIDSVINPNKSSIWQKGCFYHMNELDAKSYRKYSFKYNNYRYYENGGIKAIRDPVTKISMNFHTNGTLKNKFSVHNGYTKNIKYKNYKPVSTQYTYKCNGKLEIFTYRTDENGKLESCMNQYYYKSQKWDTIITYYSCGVLILTVKSIKCVDSYTPYEVIIVDNNGTYKVYDDVDNDIIINTEKKLLLIKPHNNREIYITLPHL